MKIENLTGLEKPLQKLVETVSEGVGVVGNHIFRFDVSKIKRIGEAEAEAEKKKIIAQAEGQDRAVEILSRAEKRFALEQYTKQINFENIVFKTKEDLKGKLVSDEPVDKDWSMRFLDTAQNISREELQNLLARILSGEIQKPGSFSFQTLDIIRSLSGQDLGEFQKFVALSTDIGIINLGEDSRKSLAKYGVSFGSYLELASIGLFNQSSTLGYDVDIESPKPHMLTIGKTTLSIGVAESQKSQNLSFSLHVFSRAGLEMRELLVDKSSNDKFADFFEDFKKALEKKGFKVSIVREN